MMQHKISDRKEIVYDRETRDFAFYIDGELIGFARTYQEAEAALDDLIYRRLTRNLLSKVAAQERVQ